MRALPLLLALACGTDDLGKRGDPVDPACDAEGPDQILLTRTLSFERAESGVSMGFDLDQVDTLDGMSEGCGVEDFVGIDGTPGIDNAMANLLPVLDTTEAVVLEDLMQASINDGSMILMFEILDLDDTLNDACVDLSVFQGVGSPMVGADGWLLANQTFDVEPDAPVTSARGGSVVDGVLEIGPVDSVALRVTVLDLDATFDVHDVRLRLKLEDDGVWRGVLGGGVETEDLLYIATLANVDPVIAQLIEPVLTAIADLSPNESGQCTQLSVALGVEAVPAFLFE